MPIYKGFSTVNRTSKFALTDMELVKQDLSNHFNIRKGQKLMNANFGTIIWDMIFEPLTDASKQAIIEDVKRVIKYDPRIAVNGVSVTEYDRGLQIQIDLTYIPTNQRDVMMVKFNADNKKAIV